LFGDCERLFQPERFAPVVVIGAKLANNPIAECPIEAKRVAVVWLHLQAHRFGAAAQCGNFRGPEQPPSQLAAAKRRVHRDGIKPSDFAPLAEQCECVTANHAARFGDNQRCAGRMQKSRERTRTQTVICESAILERAQRRDVCGPPGAQYD